MSNILSSIITTTEISMGQFALCTLASIVLGLSIAGFHSYRNRTSSGFLLTIGLIPVIVQVIIMLVNGNLGAGVAVAAHSVWSVSALLPEQRGRSAVCFWQWQWALLPEWDI